MHVKPHHGVWHLVDAQQMAAIIMGQVFLFWAPKRLVHSSTGSLTMMD